MKACLMISLCFILLTACVTVSDENDIYSLSQDKIRIENDSCFQTCYCVSRMIIKTDDNLEVNSKEKSDYRNCSIVIKSDTATWNYEGRGRIRGRGNSTWLWYPKKPYRIKLDEKASILGMAEEKDWVLLANYRDPTHIMNTFIFIIGQGIGLPYTNNSRYVEVTLNDEYIGLYQLTEQIEQGKNRININKKSGWLLSLDINDGPAASSNANNNFWSQVYNLPVCIKSPEFEESDAPETQVIDVKMALADLETIVNNHDYVKLSEVCDIHVLIKYLLIQEFVYNVELSSPRSIYMFKDEKSKWTFGPLWDFDAAFDFDWSQKMTSHQYFDDYSKTILGTNPVKHYSNHPHVSDFFTNMWHSKAFVSEVKRCWKELMPRIMSEFWPKAKACADIAIEAIARDAKHWSINKDCRTELSRMEKWLYSRTTFMDNIVNNYPEDE